MDRELFGKHSSTLGASFETYEDIDNDNDNENNNEDSIREVDVDKNMLKYMLEAHAAQLGGSGPVSNILSQLGISLPRPPPPTSAASK